MTDDQTNMREFLLKIATSISLIILWMLVNTTIGIGFNYGFFTGYPTWQNYFFYFWFLISLLAVVIYLRKKWR